MCSLTHLFLDHVSGKSVKRDGEEPVEVVQRGQGLAAQGDRNGQDGYWGGFRLGAARMYYIIKDTRNCQEKVNKISHLKHNQLASSIYIYHLNQTKLNGLLPLTIPCVLEIHFRGSPHLLGCHVTLFWTLKWRFVQLLVVSVKIAYWNLS